MIKFLPQYLKFFCVNCYSSLIGLSRHSVDIAFRKRRIKIRFCLSFIGTFSWGSIFLYFWNVWQNFSNVEFGLRFTFTISVPGVVDNVNVRYACISMGTYVNQIVLLKLGMYWLITSSTTYSIVSIMV